VKVTDNHRDGEDIYIYTAAVKFRPLFFGFYVIFISVSESQCKWSLVMHEGDFSWLRSAGKLP